MTNEIYKAFVEAGLEREARTLSTTIKGKVVPVIGHYIAIMDNGPACLIPEAKGHLKVFIGNERYKLNYEKEQAKLGLLNKILEKLER